VTAVHVVVPEGIDDPAAPSGGNTYDRRVCLGLASLGWSVHEHAVPGPWPHPGAAALAALADAVQTIPDGALALLDGLVASTAPEVLVPEAGRLRLVVLMHMPLGLRASQEADGARSGERAVLSAAAAVVTTSAWTRDLLLELYRLPADRVDVARPAVDAADPATGTAAGGELLCVAPVTFDKGHDLLLGALTAIADLSWQCTCVGSLDRDPMFAQDIRVNTQQSPLRERVRFAGPRTGADLDRTYAAADLLVLASRAETYGMVVIEALSRAIPVLATDVGGLSEALGFGAEGARPGLLVAPDDSASLATALRAWLADAHLRARLRRAASDRRASLPGWSTTASVIAEVLENASR
jgi:glycosyltransferase involved in cell wall biosynthesis